MKWLTQKYIKEQAKKSKRAAVRVSWKHWEQLATATEKELRAALYGSLPKVSVTSGYCGLCQRYKETAGSPANCYLCPANCLETWGDAFRACENWKNNKGKHSTFIRAARAMADKLKALLKPKKKGRTKCA